jgi:hypothetical protein
MVSAISRPHTSANQPLPCVARQPHEVAGFVNEEQIAGVVKILPLEVFCPELELDFVVAYDASAHHPLAEIERNLMRWPRLSLTVLGDWEIAAGSIIDPSHVNCRASSAHTATVVKPKIIGANTLIRNMAAPMAFP